MKTLRNKLYAMALISTGIVAAIVAEGDITALVFFSFIAVPLFFAKENWVF